MALSATKVSGDDDIRSLDPTARNCYFSDETDTLAIHKYYTQSNCFLECSLKYAKENLNSSFNISDPCTPWFFPSEQDIINICNPWEALDFLKLFTNVPNSYCDKCLPDCDRIQYEPSITALPFRNCDTRNQGVSKLCNVENDLVNIKKLFMQKSVHLILIVRPV